MLHLCLASLLLVAPLAAATIHNAPTSQSTHREISVDQLKAWYDQNKQIVVLDARSKPYFDGKLLPQAKWLPYDTSEKEILAAVPTAKDALIVVYCGGIGCPASGFLYDKLNSMGYTNLYEFHEGIKGWTKHNLPVKSS